jgi:hypothetical protein
VDVRVGPAEVELVVEDLEQHRLVVEAGRRPAQLVAEVLRRIREIPQRAGDDVLGRVGRIGGRRAERRLERGERGRAEPRAVDVGTERAADRARIVVGEPLHPRDAGLGDRRAAGAEPERAAVVPRRDAVEAADLLLEPVRVLVQDREVVHRKPGLEPDRVDHRVVVRRHRVHQHVDAAVRIGLARIAARVGVRLAALDRVGDVEVGGRPRVAEREAEVEDVGRRRRGELDLRPGQPGLAIERLGVEVLLEHLRRAVGREHAQRVDHAGLDERQRRAERAAGVGRRDEVVAPGPDPRPGAEPPHLDTGVGDRGRNSVPVHEPHRPGDGLGVGDPGAEHDGGHEQ